MGGGAFTCSKKKGPLIPGTVIFFVIGNILSPKFACMHTPVTKRLDYAFNPLVFIQNFCFPANNLMHRTNVCNLYECKLLIHRLIDSILS